MSNKIPGVNAAQAPGIISRNPYRVYDNPKGKEGQGINPRLLQWKYHFYFQLYNIAIQRWVWEGLPEDLPSSKIEKCLIENGKGLFVRDRAISNMKGHESGFAILPVSLVGKPEIYNIPTEYWAHANQGFSEKYDAEDSVLVFEKEVAYPTILDIDLYSDELADIAFTRGANRFFQRNPVALIGSKDDTSQFAHLVKDYTDGVSFIGLETSLMEQKNWEVVNFGVPYLGNEYSSTLRQTKAEALGMLGIEAVPIEKTERVNTLEAGGNYGFIESVRNSDDSTRDSAARKITTMFGEELESVGQSGTVTVRFNSELPSAVNGFLSDVGLQFGGIRSSTENINVTREGEEDGTADE